MTNPKRLYLAGGLFSIAEVQFNLALATRLRELGYEVWLPQEHQNDDLDATFENCLAGIDWCQVVVGNMDGPDPDSGTAAECGIAFRRRHILAYRTDFRSGGEAETGAGYNLMLAKMATARLNLDYVHMLKDPIAAIVEAIHTCLSGPLALFDEPVRVAFLAPLTISCSPPTDPTLLSLSPTGFIRFTATKGGVVIGSSVLSRDWNDKGVLTQLEVDKCPLGKAEKGFPLVFGWPADNFDVLTTDGTIHFSAE